MESAKLNLNAFLNYNSTWAESEKKLNEFFVSTDSYDNLKIEVLKGTKYINIFGSRGVGKTMNIRMLQDKLSSDFKINYLPYYGNIDLRKSIDILIIDDASHMNSANLTRLLKSKKIKQYILASDSPIYRSDITFKCIENKPFNQYELKDLIDKRLAYFAPETRKIFYETITRNKKILESSLNPRQILQFLSNSYQDIAREIKATNESLEIKDDKSKIKLPISTIISILISVILYLMSERNSEISTEEIIKELNQNHSELIELVQEQSIENDIEDIYISTDDIHLRKYPRKENSQVKVIIHKNTILKVIEKRDKWWHVEYEKGETKIYGWIYSDYLIRLIN